MILVKELLRPQQRVYAYVGFLEVDLLQTSYDFWLARVALLQFLASNPPSSSFLFTLLPDGLALGSHVAWGQQPLPPPPPQPPPGFGRGLMPPSPVESADDMRYTKAKKCSSSRCCCCSAVHCTALHCTALQYSAVGGRTRCTTLIMPSWRRACV
jgi:hypothetical protein